MIGNSWVNTDQRGVYLPLSLISWYRCLPKMTENKMRNRTRCNRGSSSATCPGSWK